MNHDTCCATANIELCWRGVPTPLVFFSFWVHLLIATTPHVPRRMAWHHTWVLTFYTPGVVITEAVWQGMNVLFPGGVMTIKYHERPFFIKEKIIMMIESRGERLWCITDHLWGEAAYQQLHLTDDQKCRVFMLSLLLPTHWYQRDIDVILNL